MSRWPSYRVAAAHAAPVFLNPGATADKACSLIEEAARNGARLIAFPETFVAAFPLWSVLRAPIYNHDMFRRLAASAVTVPGPEVARIAAAARKFGIHVSIGINEGTSASVGCMWNANLLIGEDGSILNHHRKLVPTYFEKLTWANGDGAGLRVVDGPLGRLGMLICGENTNPLARFTLMAQGEQLHIASFPPMWPTHDPEDSGNYDLARAIRIRIGAHCFEAKCFAVVASGFLDDAAVQELARGDANALRIIEQTPRGVSMFVGPDGEQFGPSLRDEEGLIYADVDLAGCVAPKQFHDVVGYYNRFDIFRLQVNRSANRPISFLSDGKPAQACEGRDEAGDGAATSEVLMP